MIRILLGNLKTTGSIKEKTTIPEAFELLEYVIEV